MRHLETVILHLPALRLNATPNETFLSFFFVHEIDFLFSLEFETIRKMLRSKKIVFFLQIKIHFKWRAKENALDGKRREKMHTQQKHHTH